MLCPAERRGGDKAQAISIESPEKARAYRKVLMKYKLTVQDLDDLNTDVQEEEDQVDVQDILDQADLSPCSACGAEGEKTTCFFVEEYIHETAFIHEDESMDLFIRAGEQPHGYTHSIYCGYGSHWDGVIIYLTPDQAKVVGTDLCSDCLRTALEKLDIITLQLLHDDLKFVSGSPKELL